MFNFMFSANIWEFSKLDISLSFSLALKKACFFGDGDEIVICKWVFSCKATISLKETSMIWFLKFSTESHTIYINFGLYCILIKYVNCVVMGKKTKADVKANLAAKLYGGYLTR